MRFNGLMKMMGISLTFALLTIAIFLPYLPTTVNEKEVVLGVGWNIITDGIRPNTPTTIRVNNSYKTEIQITSPCQIDFSYRGETTKSTDINADGMIFRQVIKFKLPIVEGKMNIDCLPNGSEIKLVSDNSYFTVTYYKPLGKRYVNLLMDILLFLNIIGIVIVIKNAITYCIKKKRKIATSTYRRNHN